MEFVKISKENDETFKGTDLWSPIPGYPTFGGQIAAQSLISAFYTVEEDTIPINLSILFINKCKSDQDTRYQVKRLRDGGILEMRQVDCYQNDILVSSMHASFSRPEDNAHDYEDTPYRLYEDTFVPFAEYISNALNNTSESEANIRMKFQVLHENMRMLLNVIDVELGKETGDMRQIRIRIKNKQSTVAVKAALVTLVSDLLLVETALIACNLTMFSKEISLLTSMNHVIHFIDLERDLGECVYYIVKCKGIKNSKAICEGQLLHEDGSLICLTSQQGIFRVKPVYSKN
ncbi:thioesterase-like [Ordospora pajunii]|uniref:thioesterase-like n=1 Tax=Ordospora pajunii TaxID=3039483 RepID=UPI002952609D|nr:thioesterase-like [Ordospora pajunii]KAH9411331.1 thioesterase-like [Ordospora pajunii]